MTVCPECGTRNADDEQFCGACGTYLEWEAGARPTPAPVDEPEHARLDEPATTSDQGPQPATTSDQRPEPATTSDGEPAARAVPVPEPTPAPVAAPAPGTAAAAAATAPASEPDAAPGTAREPDAAPAPSHALAGVPEAGVPAAAAALVATPPPPPAAPPRQPAAVRPGVPRPAPAPRRGTDEPEPTPGDLVCGSCGAGNTPTRKFCRRCGASLADARVQPRRSWWYRLWHPEPRRGPVAGYRPPRRRRFPTRTAVTVLVLGALVTAAASLRPEIERFAITVLDRVQGNVAVNPVTVTASSELPDRPAAQARDGATNLAWSPAEPGEGIGQYLEMTFTQPFRLTRVLVHAGASDVEKEFLASASPRVLTLTATTATGTQQEVELTLADRVGLQSVAVGVDEVVALRLTISSTYRATPQTHVAVAEVELRGRT
ncbi:conserved hypothetical protein [Cellulomonas flavigena DSM 20109]|uniref:GATA-type domain-containing protein n=1 Tax=Cellulomonas flavigena (strain ATCC 482 / DSM 20109 / BCRC 11376 / JCM 18109 / NBRC 3775 / NCIMB 8073 / NRS 134) TaxID=446466 RepID=D5UGR4_CELFN|nr:zinc ribbon domain-containing protein [Cellulomonas flavigena]ADG75162.1 conserved hypothetical protein [Cellulomonas flavigena DSM 20109]